MLATGALDWRWRRAQHAQWGDSSEDKAQIGLSRTAAAAAQRALAALPWGEKEGREAAAAAGLLSYDGGWCRC